MTIEGKSYWQIKKEKEEKRKKIEEQIRKVENANKPGYRTPEEDMVTVIKDGVVTYRRRRRIKKNE